MVLLVDEQLSRNEWKAGRVVSVLNEGPHVRKVEVRRVDGKVVPRDRSKVVLLEMDDDGLYEEE